MALSILGAPSLEPPTPPLPPPRPSAHRGGGGAGAHQAAAGPRPPAHAQKPGGCAHARWARPGGGRRALPVGRARSKAVGLAALYFFPRGTKEKGWGGYISKTCGVRVFKHLLVTVFEKNYCLLKSSLLSRPASVASGPSFPQS